MDARLRRPDPQREVVVVSHVTGSQQRLRQALGSFAGAAGVAVLAGLAILLAGLPVALAMRALLEVFLWFFGGRS
jgi:hypothetical protein